jgi:hypothetical protein
MIHLGRFLVAACLTLMLLSAGLADAQPHVGAAASNWQQITYRGAAVAHIPSYSLAYPPGWTARRWPDTLAGYGRVDVRSPTGMSIDLILLPLRPHGPALADLIAHDASFLSRPTRDRVTLPPGSAVRVSGSPTGTGMTDQFLYLKRGRIVYRFFSARPLGSAERDALMQVTASLHVPAAPSRPTGPPQAPPQPPVETCCHCPAWGTGWGTVLTRLDGVAVYWNAGNSDNGCDGTYGILYQCVELAQRYFALRWGYPAIWSGVAAAADMRTHHPDGIQFIPNGGSPGPLEGDALLFYGGAFGHVALVRRVDRQMGEIDVVEENWSATGEASLPIYADNTIAIRDSTYGSYTVAGWLHSTRNVANAP